MAESSLNKLKHIIATDLDVNIKLEEITDDASFFEDGLGLDSIAIVDLIVLIEKRFGFEFADDEISEELFTTVRTTAEFIEKKMLSSDGAGES
jgi:acyl carrier protein